MIPSNYSRPINIINSGEREREITEKGNEEVEKGKKREIYRDRKI